MTLLFGTVTALLALFTGISLWIEWHRPNTQRRIARILAIIAVSGSLYGLIHPPSGSGYSTPHHVLIIIPPYCEGLEGQRDFARHLIGLCERPPASVYLLDAVTPSRVSRATWDGEGIVLNTPEDVRNYLAEGDSLLILGYPSTQLQEVVRRCYDVVVNYGGNPLRNGLWLSDLPKKWYAGKPESLRVHLALPWDGEDSVPLLVLQNEEGRIDTVSLTAMEDEREWPKKSSAWWVKPQYHMREWSAVVHCNNHRSGKHHLQFRLIQDGKDIVRETLYWEAQSTPPRRIGLRLSSPSFESKALKEWLKEEGHAVWYETEISRNKTLRDRDSLFLNDESLFRAVELLIIDAAAIHDLPNRLHTELEAAIQGGMGMIVIQDANGNVLRDKTPSLFTPKSREYFNLLSGLSDAKGTLIFPSRGAGAKIIHDAVIADLKGVPRLKPERLPDDILAFTEVNSERGGARVPLLWRETLGEGQVVFVPLLSSYALRFGSLDVLGRESPFGQLWKEILNATLPPLATLRQEEPLQRRDEPGILQLEMPQRSADLQAPRLVSESPKGKSDTLFTNEGHDRGHLRSGQWIAFESGWYHVKVTHEAVALAGVSNGTKKEIRPPIQMDYAIYVYDRHEWSIHEEVNAESKLYRTRLAQGAATPQSATPEHQVAQATENPFLKALFAAMALIGLLYLWAEERLQGGRIPK